MGGQGRVFSKVMTQTTVYTKSIARIQSSIKFYANFQQGLPVTNGVYDAKCVVWNNKEKNSSIIKQI